MDGFPGFPHGWLPRVRMGVPDGRISGIPPWLVAPCAYGSSAEYLEIARRRVGCPVCVWEFPSRAARSRRQCGLPRVRMGVPAWDIVNMAASGVAPCAYGSSHRVHRPRGRAPGCPVCVWEFHQDMADSRLPCRLPRVRMGVPQDGAAAGGEGQVAPCAYGSSEREIGENQRQQGCPVCVWEFRVA